jgi:hypothetical protein
MPMKQVAATVPREVLLETNEPWKGDYKASSSSIGRNFYHD